MDEAVANRKSSSLALEAPLALVALAIALGLFLLHRGQPFSSPLVAARGFFAACAAKDLQAVRIASTPNHFAAFVRHFGAQRHERAWAAFNQAVRLGQARWRQYRERAEALASAEYQRLHERILALGKETFNRLPVEERMRLMDDQAKYNAAVFDGGLASLPSEDRARVENVEEFRQGRDRERFVQREGFKLLSAEDRAAVGSPAALSAVSTPEKLALLDSIGIPMLPEAVRKEIVGISRAELSDADGFALKHGVAPAKEFLAAITVPAAPTETRPCSYTRVDASGSLLRGGEAECVLSVPSGERQREIKLSLRKSGFQWLVDAIQPALYESVW